MKTQKELLNEQLENIKEKLNDIYYELNDPIVHYDKLKEYIDDIDVEFTDVHEIQIEVKECLKVIGEIDSIQRRICNLEDIVEQAQESVDVSSKEFDYKEYWYSIYQRVKLEKPENEEYILKLVNQIEDDLEYNNG